MVFHIKAFLGKCIIWCMDMGAHDKPEFTGAVKLKIKSWMYPISWGHGGWDSFGLLTYMGVPDPSLAKS